MKPSAAEVANKGARPHEMQAKTEKIKSSLKNVKKEVGKAEKLKYKPLTGKVFYLDIPSNVISEKIGKDLKELGGRVESFLSKDISYLVSSKKEAKFAPTLGQISPAPSPEAVCNGGNSTPHPSNRKDRQDGSSFKAADAVRLSRGKSLAEKAIREQELIPSGSILSNALSWGVKVLHIDDVKHYIEQKKKELYLIKSTGSSFKDVGKQVTTQKSKTGRLKNPFVKVEDRSRSYRPFYLQLPSFPSLNYCVPKPCSPFEVDKKHPSGQKQTQYKQRCIHPKMQRSPIIVGQHKIFFSFLPLVSSLSASWMPCMTRTIELLFSFIRRTKKGEDIVNAVGRNMKIYKLTLKVNSTRTLHKAHSIKLLMI